MQEPSGDLVTVAIEPHSSHKEFAAQKLFRLGNGNEHPRASFTAGRRGEKCLSIGAYRLLV